MTKRGRLIVIEGLDRSGKSTQCQRLVTALSQNASPSQHTAPSTTAVLSKESLGTSAAILQKFPDRSTTIGTMIDHYLQQKSDLDDRCIHLLFSANRWELASRLLEFLEAGVHVVLDRYIYSGVAFSVVKGLDRAWCKACDVGLPAPDLVLFLDVSEQVASLRGGFGEERYEKAETQRLVRKEFSALFQGMDQVRVIDAGQEIDCVQGDIWRHVESMLNQEVGPVGRIS